MGLLQSAAGETDAPAGKTPPPPGRDNMEQIQALAVRKPVVAAINGAAAGIGLVTALMADVRFAAEGIKMTTAFSRRGEYFVLPLQRTRRSTDPGNGKPQESLKEIHNWC